MRDEKSGCWCAARLYCTRSVRPARQWPVFGIGRSLVMSIGTSKRQSRTATARGVLCLSPMANGIGMTAHEFDRADFEEGWRYELVNGVLIVTPIPLENEADPN